MEKERRKLYKESALCRDANPRRRTTSSAWINISNGKGSTSWVRVRKHSENEQANGPCVTDHF